MTKPFQIRSAEPGDADSIYGLKLNAFGQRYLSYTIYQLPLSVNYIRELISSGYGSTKHKLVVAVLDGRIWGYYAALHRGSDFHLNYIAVDATARRDGLGSFLLSHFEDCGRMFGCTRLTLDVFESNLGVRAWYERRGYSSVSTCFLAQVSISKLLGDTFTALDWSPEWPAAAFDEEGSRGFSKAEYQCGSRHIAVGLIGKRICKLLAYDGVTLDDALHTVAGLCPSRDHVIVPDLAEIPIAWPVLAAEKSSQLVKAVHQNDN